MTWREDNSGDPSGGWPGSPFASPNPHRLYRDQTRGKLFGVCAGIADYLGVKVRLVRVFAVLGAVFFTMPVVGAYLLAALVLKHKPARVYASREEEDFWRSVAAKPDVTLAGLRHKFREMERRLGGMETYVSSKEFELNRAIGDLDR
ncbi:phage-shock protein [Skermanella stibiiresistens SB22]|uniref:Phage-shock protein n=1 Tax=Skermanella stibiiresistens SB22 TaxID=1385369 RepID=W9H5Y2_9PROT|nr:envelope stress response membrane protein PspC [Skermanella stibiiresistens]EWY39158.1 phage-shock protein [Skermanella stibiiresistens SB22]